MPLICLTCSCVAAVCICMVSPSSFAAAQEKPELFSLRPPSLESLIVELGGKDPAARRSAAEALRQASVRLNVDKAVPALHAALKDDDALTRLAVIETLGEIGPSAKEALPDVIS